MIPRLLICPQIPHGHPSGTGPRFVLTASLTQLKGEMALERDSEQAPGLSQALSSRGSIRPAPACCFPEAAPPRSVLGRPLLEAASPPCLGITQSRPSLRAFPSPEASERVLPGHASDSPALRASTALAQTLQLDDLAFSGFGGRSHPVQQPSPPSFPPVQPFSFAALGVVAVFWQWLPVHCTGLISGPQSVAFSCHHSDTLMLQEPYSMCPRVTFQFRIVKHFAFSLALDGQTEVPGRHPTWWESNMR